MSRLQDAAVRTAGRRTLFDHASTITSANATSTTTRSAHATAVSPRRPTLARSPAFASNRAQAGGAAPFGGRTVSGEFGAPATTAIAKYPATSVASATFARREVCSGTATHLTAGVDAQEPR